MYLQVAELTGISGAMFAVLGDSSPASSALSNILPPGTV